MGSLCTVRGPDLRARLSALGLTQTALADRCELPLRTLQRWLSGGRLRLADAERVAEALGVGTSMVFDGVPQGSVLTHLRTASRLLGTRAGAMSGALRLTLEHFDFVERLLSLHAHPREGYVHREAITPDDQHGFIVLQVQLPRGRACRVALTTQVGRHFRYEFGELQVAAEEVIALEHLHTRSARAPRATDGSFSLWTWAPPEMRALVLVASEDLRVRRVEGRGLQLFDLGDPRTRHAVCTRPAPMHLRAAGLPSVFDRLVGPREGRIDVPFPAASQPSRTVAQAS